MNWLDKRKNKEWKVGNRYWVYDNGRRMIGEIVGINPAGCVVKWDDGSTTNEGTPEPASDWWKIHGGSND